MIRWTMTLLTLLLMLSLTGCGQAPKLATTRVDPATVALSDHFNEKLAGDTRTAKITVTPPAAPAIAPAAATAPAPAPSTQSSITVTQAPTPVSVRIDGREVTAPAGSAVTLEVADTRSPAESTHDRTANAAGPTLRTDGDKGTFDASAPKVDLGNVINAGIGGGGSSGGGGNASGGSTSTGWQIVEQALASAANAGEKWGWLIGLLLIVAAVGMIVVEHIIGGVTDWPLVGLLAGSGVAVITFSIIAEKYAWVFLILFIVLLLAVVAYVLYWKFGSASAVVAKVESVIHPAPAAPNPTPAPVSPGLNVTNK